MRTPSRRTLPVAAVLAFALPAGAAQAAPVHFLNAAKPVSAVGDVNSASGAPHALAMGSGGQALALWGGSNGANAVRVAERSPAGGFGAAHDLLAGSIAGAQLAVAADGTAVAIWRGYDAGDVEQVFASVRPAGGAFTAPVQVSQETVPFTNIDPAVGISASGRATIVWRGGTADNAASRVIRVRDVGADGAALGAPVAVSPMVATSPTVAVDAAGNALVGSVVDGHATARFRRADGTQEGDAIFTGSAAPTAAFDAAGNAFVVRRDAGILVRTRPAGPNQVFGDQEDLTPGAEQPLTFEQLVRVDAAGRVFVAWIDATGTRRVRVAVRPAGLGQDFAPAQTVEPAGAQNAADLDLAASADGAALLAWTRGTTVHAAGRLAGSDVFGPAQAVPVDPGQEAVQPHVALDGAGRGLVSYGTSPLGGDDRTLKVLPFDDVPRVQAAFPASAVVGVSTAFSAKAVDPWAPIASTTWAFGDGASADGDSVERAFQAPGAPNATVTVTDADGNASTASGSVTVTAAPAGGGQDVVAPGLGQVTLRRVRFRAGASPRGTSFRFTLTEAAKVSFGIERTAAGRRVGKGCRAATKALRRRPACVRVVRLGTLLRPGLAAGARSVAFSGRSAGTRRLKPGRYQVRIVATDAAGNRSAPVVRTFTILAPKGSARG